jgi:ATP-binding cassette subfamily F protein 3
LERVDDVESDAPTVSFKFRFSRPSGRSVTLLEDINKSYPGVPILHKTGAEIEMGDKIALIGANGKGKSTLLRIIAGTETYEGKAQLGFNVIKTFFAQHQLEALTLENTILQELQSFAPTYSETELRTLLGCFLFTGDDVFKKIKVLSGGEKSRVALAKTLTSDSNFLILDEPTNHLDIQSVNILIQALQQFEGTCIIVSHDRYFLSQVANRIWFIENQEIKTYPGTYDEFEVWDAERKKNKLNDGISASSLKKIVAPSVEIPKPLSNSLGTPGQGESKTPVKADAEGKSNGSKNNDSEAKKLEKRLSLLEKEIYEVEKRKQEIETELSNPEHFTNSEIMNRLNQDYTQIQGQLNLLNSSWEEIADQLV